jgi:serine/threonine protein kinase
MHRKTRRKIIDGDSSQYQARRTVRLSNPAKFKSRLTQVNGVQKLLTCIPKDYEVVKKKAALGHGSFGAVYHICRKGECKYALKSMIFRKEDRDSLTRDLYFMFWLNEYAKGLGPKVYSEHQCNKDDKGKKLFELALVMDKFDGDASDLRDGGIPEDVLLKLFALVVHLGKCGIVHGDLRTDQFLWRKKNGKLEIVLNDYGFAGQMTKKQIQTAGIQLLAKNALDYAPTRWDSKTHNPIPFVPQVGWQKVPGNGYINCLQGMSGNETINSKHPWHKYVGFLDLFTLDAELRMDHVRIKLRNGSTVPYGGCTLIPQDAWESFARTCSATAHMSYPGRGSRGSKTSKNSFIVTPQMLH